jgi:hypothetical protein
VSRRTLVAAVLLLALVVVTILVVVPRLAATRLERAVAMLPESTLRASYTDWDKVSEQADGGGITAATSEAKTEAFLDRAFGEDLTTVSALGSSFAELAANYEVTPLDAEWEIYGQGRDGAVDLLRLGAGVDLEALEERFAALGYQSPPEGEGESGVWVGTPELLAGFDVPLQTLQLNVAVVESERVLVMSDTPEYAASVVELVQGDGASLETTAGVPELVAVAEEPTVAVLWAGDFACEDLAMSGAGPAEAEEGAALVAEAGGVHPLTGLVMAQGASSLTVGMTFASEEQAVADLQPRTDLASGPAPGQGGTFPERFEVTEATSEDTVVRLELEPVEGPVLADLGQGPVLFATC